VVEIHTNPTDPDSPLCNICHSSCIEERLPNYDNNNSINNNTISTSTNSSQVSEQVQDPSLFIPPKVYLNNVISSNNIVRSISPANPSNATSSLLRTDRIPTPPSVSASSYSNILLSRHTTNANIGHNHSHQTEDEEEEDQEEEDNNDNEEEEDNDDDEEDVLGINTLANVLHQSLAIQLLSNSSSNFSTTTTTTSTNTNNPPHTLSSNSISSSNTESSSNTTTSASQNFLTSLLLSLGSFDMLPMRSLLSLGSLGNNTSSSSSSGSGGFMTLGDYVLGDIDSLLARLHELEINHSGNIPTSKGIIDKLQVISKNTILKTAECSICQELLLEEQDEDKTNIPSISITTNENNTLLSNSNSSNDISIITSSSSSTSLEPQHNNNIIQLPICEHQFHYNCIIPWLKTNNTCPVCRKELLTDDTEYNKRKGIIEN